MLDSESSRFSHYLTMVSTHYTSLFFFFFFNDTATTEIYTLSLHDALPIFSSARSTYGMASGVLPAWKSAPLARRARRDRKSTRLNSSHLVISYAVFCLKKKKSRPHVNRWVLTTVSNRIVELKNLSISPLLS